MGLTATTLFSKTVFGKLLVDLQLDEGRFAKSLGD
jgi:hypothetical protein